MRISFSMVGLLLFASSLVYAATLDFPDLGLSSSAQEIRAWAREHAFTATQAAEPDQLAYQRKFSNGQRETVSFVPSSKGVDMLQFEQRGVLESSAKLRQLVYKHFGKPEKDQILKGGTLRLIYAYEYSEPARRVFLLQPHYVSMFLMTEAYVSRLDEAQARTDRVKEEKTQAAEREARNAWLIPLLWMVGVLVGLTALIKILPQAIRDPVTSLLRSGLNGLLEITQEVVTFLFYQASGLLLFAMMLLSGLAVGSGAVEWDTSWWWGVPWIFGFVVTLKAYDEDFFPWTFIAIGFYALALVGVFFQGTW